jgi:hypothetical protein
VQFRQPDIQRSAHQAPLARLTPVQPMLADWNCRNELRYGREVADAASHRTAANRPRIRMDSEAMRQWKCEIYEDSTSKDNQPAVGRGNELPHDQNLIPQNGI